MWSWRPWAHAPTQPDFPSGHRPFPPGHAHPILEAHFSRLLGGFPGDRPLQGCFLPGTLPSPSLALAPPTRRFRAPPLWVPGCMNLGMVGLGQLSIPPQLLPPDRGSALRPQCPLLHPADPLAGCHRGNGWVALGCCWGGHSAPEVCLQQAPGRRSGHSRSQARWGASSKSLTPLPGSLVALKPRIRDPPSPWASAPGPQKLRNAAGPRREGRRPRPPLAPTPCCARSTSPMLPCTHAHLMLSATLSPLLLGIRMVSPVAPPPPESGAGPGGTWPPPRCPHSEATMFLLSWCVSPASSLPLLSSLSPRPPRSLFTRLQLTFLGLSLSPSLPVSFLPSAPHRDVPGPVTGPPPLPLPLCSCLSVSFCPVTSDSFSGADHLFPGCFAAVLTLWCGQNNSDFLIPSAVNPGSLLLTHSIFNLTLPLQLFQSPPPRACLCEHVSVCVYVRVLCSGRTSGRAPRASRVGWGVSLSSGQGQALTAGAPCL